MCELFGFSSSEKASAVDGLRHFAEHSGRNPHGWGLAYYADGGAILKKRAVEARKSAEYYDTIERARGSIIVSHIRHASCGRVDEANCHPFVQTFLGREWVFAHNGHVDGVARHPRSDGQTDSESVFNILLDSIREHRRAGDAYHGLVGGVSSLFNDYEFGRQVGINFVMSDGEMLYAFSHHAEKPMYISRSAGPGGRALTVSTQKLGGRAWETLPSDRLLLIREGEVRRLSDRI